MKCFLWKVPLAAFVILLIFTIEPYAHARQTGHGSITAAPTHSLSNVTSAQSNEPRMPASGEATVQPARTFSGRIIKEGGEIVLQNPVTKVIHKLSDASKAKKYLNQQVKVTGKLDQNTNTIQIESISPAS